MKKTLFDPKLYREGLRQLRVIGIVQLAVSIVMTVLPFLAIALFSPFVGSDDPIVTLYCGYYGDTNVVEFTSVYSIFPIIAVVFPVLYTLYIFRFQTVRSADDFYHGLPQTRSCLSCSFLAACGTWYAIGVLASSLVMYGVFCVTCAVLHSEAVLPLVSVLAAIVGAWIAGVLAIAGAFLSASLSGRIFSALCGTAMILFVPRMLLNSLLSTTIHRIGVLDFSAIKWILAPTNLLVDSSQLTSPSAWVYSGVLALLYLALGVWCFSRRKAEAAGQSTVSRGMQTVYRLTFAFACCVPILSALYSENVETDNTMNFISYFSIDTGVAIFLYGLVVAAYFLFELITTRKARNLLKAIPWLGVLAALNVVAYFGMFGATQLAWAYCPASKAVQSVSIDEIVAVQCAPRSFVNHEQKALEDAGMNGVQIQDEDVRRFITKALRATIKENRNCWVEDNDEEVYYYDDWDEWTDEEYIEFYLQDYYFDPLVCLRVTMITDGVPHQRLVSLYKTDYQTIMETLQVENSFVVRSENITKTDIPETYDEDKRT